MFEALSFAVILTIGFLLVYFIALIGLTYLVTREIPDDLYEGSELFIAAAVTMGAALVILWDHSRRENERALYECVEDQLYEVVTPQDVVPLVRSCVESVGFGDDRYDNEW